MRKAKLEGNILPKAKQRFLVDGLPETMIHLTRGELPIELGVINLKDQTRVPGGRKRSGEFEVEIQMARDIDRNTYVDWLDASVDQEGDSGIEPTYKRDATIIFLRLYRGSPGARDTGSDLPPVRVRLIGVWCSKLTLPSGDINNDNGDDADSIMKCTLQYDDIRVERN